MIRRKPEINSLFSVSPGDAADTAQKKAQVFRNRRQSGFSLIELLVILAVVGVVSGFAILNIRNIIPGMRANQAMYQIIASMREARELAMTQNREVLVTFDTGDNQLQAQIANGSNGGAVDGWGDIPPTRVNPSMALENGNQFSRNGLPAPPDGDDTGDIVFGSSTSGTVVFTPDGFLSNVGDTGSPVNGTIYIGAPDGDPKLARAVTMLGATGRIRGWQLMDGGWVRSR